MATITIHGNLAQDPELSYTPNGTAVAELIVLENRRRKNAAGEWEDDEPNRFRVKAWRSLAENVAESVSTGDRVSVTGSIKTERFTDRDTGKPRTAQHVDADDIGVSLKYHTARVTKVTRTSAEPAPEPTE